MPKETTSNHEQNIDYPASTFFYWDASKRFSEFFDDCNMQLDYRRNKLNGILSKI